MQFDERMPVRWLRTLRVAACASTMATAVCAVLAAVAAALCLLSAGLYQDALFGFSNDRVEFASDATGYLTIAEDPAQPERGWGYLSQFLSFGCFATSALLLAAQWAEDQAEAE